MGGQALPYGPIGSDAVHLCVDMQRMFAEATEWHTPWMDRVRPVALRIAERHAGRTIFTRFIPASRPGEGDGAWRRYYRRWASMTLERLGRDMIELAPELAALVPPAALFDKTVYSPWMNGALDRILRDRGARSLVVSGGETDVCVSATVLGAVDLGYRVVLATDALCSSSDPAHDAAMQVYRTRFGQQVETATAEDRIGYLATMTSDALMTAIASSPTFSDRSSIASLVMDEWTVTPLPMSMWTWPVVCPFWTRVIRPLIWLRALSFIMVPPGRLLCPQLTAAGRRRPSPAATPARGRRFTRIVTRLSNTCDVHARRAGA